MSCCADDVCQDGKKKADLKNIDLDISEEDEFSDDEIHKIAIIDLRILNLDRNECNILV